MHREEPDRLLGLKTSAKIKTTKKTMWEAILALFGAIAGAIISSDSTQQANSQNITYANQNREDQQAYNTAAAQAANNETRRQYWELYSPQAKVQQLKNAGLSVGLMYGQGGAGGGGSTAAQASPANTAAPVVNPLLNMGMIDTILNAVKAPAEIRKTEAEASKTKADEKKVNQDITESNQRIRESNANIRKITAEAATEEERKVGQIIQNKLGELDIENEKLQLEFNRATNETKIKIVDKEFEKIDGEIKIMQEQLAQEKIETKYAEDIKKETLQNIRAQRNKFVAETYLTWMKAQTETAQKALLEEQTRLTGDQRSKLQAETTNLIKSYEKIENEIREGEALADIAELDRENYKLKMWISAAASGISAIGDIVSKIRK